MDRRSTTMAVVLVATLVGAVTVMFVSGAVPDLGTVAEERERTPASASVPITLLSTAPSVMPTEGTAASTIRVMEFDLLPTGTVVPAWDPSGSGLLEVAAMPTAVDRSARLSAEDTGSACMPLGGDVTNLTAELMVEPLPPEGLAALGIELADGSRLTLTVSAQGARLVSSAEPIELEPRTWYRWSISRREGSYRIALAGADGAELDVTTVSAPGAAEQFCMSTESPARIYLDSLAWEGH